MNISVSWDDFEGVEYTLRKHSHEICAIGEVYLITLGYSKSSTTSLLTFLK